MLLYPNCDNVIQKIITFGCIIFKKQTKIWNILFTNFFTFINVIFCSSFKWNIKEENWYMKNIMNIDKNLVEICHKRTGKTKGV